MFGITRTGTSITVHVTGFQPKFYVRVPERWGETPKQIEGKCRHLETVIRKKHCVKKCIILDHVIRVLLHSL